MRGGNARVARSALRQPRQRKPDHVSLPCPRRGAVDPNFSATCKLLYFPSKKQEMTLKVFTCPTEAPLPKVPSTKAENQQELLAKFDAMLASYDCVGESACVDFFRGSPCVGEAA